MDQTDSFQWAPVAQSLAGFWKGRAEVHSLPSRAKVKDERNYTITFFNMLSWCAQGENDPFLTMIQNYTGSNSQNLDT